MKDYTLKQIKGYFQENVLSVRASQTTTSFSYVLGQHENRQDDARDVIRSAQARFKEIPEIIPENTSERSRGSITIDNCDYGRYMGEIQIVKNDLAADEKVNVVGKIIAEDRPLITFIGSGQKFKIEKEKNND